VGSRVGKEDTRRKCESMAAVASAVPRLTAEELMADPRFAREVDKEWDEIKKGIKAKVKKAKKGFKGSIPDRYVEALKIHLAYEKYRKEGQWDNAFYCLHLYLECVLDKRLHRPRTEGPKYEKQATDVLDTLQTLQANMNSCMQGIRLQIIEKKRRSEELRRAKEAATDKKNATASSAPISIGTATGAPGTTMAVDPDQVRSAIDALRIDGKRTEGRHYDPNYKRNSGKKTSSGSPSPSASSGAPPPSYAAATSGSRFLHTHGKNENEDVGRDVDFKVKRVTGDGNCAFRAIVQGQDGGKLDASSETRLSQNLRQIAANELRRCADEEMTGTGLTVEQLVLMKDAKFESFSSYISAMSRNEYAGETEFWLLARKLNVNIAIYQDKGTFFEHLITYGDADTEPIKLLWKKGMSEAGNHYDLLLPNV